MKEYEVLRSMHVMQKFSLIGFSILFIFLISFQPVNSLEYDFKEVNAREPIDLFLYSPQFDALTVNEEMTITPLFTPDNAVQVYADWLSRANTSINVEAQYITKFNDANSWTDDTNPIAKGLVDAKNRGVNVRVIVNGDADSDDVASYFQSVGIEIRYMGENTGAEQRITATHNKYVSIDGKVTIISSINFGYNSFMNNREAGVVVQNPTVTNYFDQVFELDWGMSATPLTRLNAAIDNTKEVPKVESTREPSFLDYSTNFEPVDFTGVYNVTAYLSLIHI